MKILILGGAGFIGANLARRCLEEKNAEITVFDSLDPLFKSSKKNLEAIWERISFIQGDIRDQELINRTVAGKDVIFNCAAQTSHPYSLKYPALDVEINCLGNIRVLEAVRQHSPEAIVVFTSSSTLIGKAHTPVVDEEHAENPLELYSANKGVAEKYYRIYHTAHGLKTISIRFANLYGPYGKGDSSFGFINYFISLAVQGGKIPIYGKGGQRRNVLYVEDACNLLMEVILHPELWGTVHFGVSDQHLSVREIAEGIVKVFEAGEIQNVEWPEERRKIEIDDVIISSDRLRKIVKWVPGFDFESGLQKTKSILQSGI